MDLDQDCHLAAVVSSVRFALEEDHPEEARVEALADPQVAMSPQGHLADRREDHLEADSWLVGALVAPLPAVEDRVEDRVVVPVVDLAVDRRV